MESTTVNPGFADAVTDAVMSLPAAKLIGLRIVRLAPGEADLELDFREALSSRGVFQGGVIGMLADFAGGAAAGTLLAPNTLNMTMDFTVKLLAPARGERLVAQGRVLQPGRTVTVAQADVYALRGESRSLCATALVTMRTVAATGQRA